MRRPTLALILAASCGAAITASAPRHALAQSPTATLAGTVHAETGAPVVRAIVRVGGRVALTDSLGRFVLQDLPGDSAQVRIMALGIAWADTTISLRAGTSTRLDITLRKEGWISEADAAGLDAAAGRVDSSALGLLRAGASDSAPPLSFGVFGARLLAALVRDRAPDSNTVVSPASAGLALSLALLGARGSTATALSTALGTEALDRATLTQRGVSFLAAASGRQDVLLQIANAVWVDSSVVLTEGYSASAAAWRAKVATLRLASRSAMGPINRWADSATHGRIPTILDKPLPDTTALFIANAVYFKGKWLDPFDESETAPHDFTLHSGSRIRVAAMMRTGHMAHRRGAGYQMVRLPYRAGRAAMYVILPDSGVAPSALARHFAEHGWPASLGERDMQMVHLVLPKLHVEHTLDLIPLLRAFGAGIALDCDRADFGDVAVVRADGRRLALCIGEAVQKVYLDVDEQGTEAAAITGITVLAATSVPPPPLEFIVDRPFLFILRDEVTGAELFVGHIGRP